MHMTVGRKNILSINENRNVCRQRHITNLWVELSLHIHLSVKLEDYDDVMLLLQRRNSLTKFIAEFKLK